MTGRHHNEPLGYIIEAIQKCLLVSVSDTDILKQIFLPLIRHLEMDPINMWDWTFLPHSSNCLVHLSQQVSYCICKKPLTLCFTLSSMHCMPFSIFGTMDQVKQHCFSLLTGSLLPCLFEDTWCFSGVAVVRVPKRICQQCSFPKPSRM